VEPAIYEPQALYHGPASVRERETLMARESMVQARNLAV
jgi:hypothetical protein